MNHKSPPQPAVSVEQLLPCPLCGGDELSHGFVEGGGVHFGTAGCEACDLQVTQPSEEEAIVAWNTRAAPPAREWPDIGPDPFQGPNENRTVEKAHARLRDAYALQQPIVPSQTALVWRDDIGRVHMRLVQLETLFAERKASAAPPADGVPNLEALGEKLFILSDHLRRSGVLSDAGTHIAYEDVVGEFQKLSTAPKAPTAPIGKTGKAEALPDVNWHSHADWMEQALSDPEWKPTRANYVTAKNWLRQNEKTTRETIAENVALQAALADRAQGEGEKAS